MAPIFFYLSQLHLNCFIPNDSISEGVDAAGDGGGGGYYLVSYLKKKYNLI